MNDLGEKDLNHADWVLFTQEKLIQQVATDISITYFINESGTRCMQITGIPKTVIGQLKFLTNTDQNNNYLYLNDFTIYVDGLFSPLVIPGFNDVVKSMYRNSDLTGYLCDCKTHKPFSVKNIKNNSTFKGDNFNQFVDAYSGLVPYVADTVNRNKTYGITLVPGP
jgi:hypothetical protein